VHCPCALDDTRSRCELRCLQMNGIANDTLRQLVDNNIWGWWQQEWDEDSTTGSWTKRLIPDVRSWASRTHGVTGYYMTWFLTSHGCFQAYLHKFARVQNPYCMVCGDPINNTEHTFFRCG
jgi:hypothetical protein